jgi:hypothetical protein
MTHPRPGYSGCAGLAIRRTSDGGLRGGLQTLDLIGGGTVTAVGDCGVKERQSDTAAARGTKIPGSEERGARTMDLYWIASSHGLHIASTWPPHGLHMVRATSDGLDAASPQVRNLPWACSWAVDTAVPGGVWRCPEEARAAPSASLSSSETPAKASPGSTRASATTVARPSVSRTHPAGRDPQDGEAERASARPDH